MTASAAVTSPTPLGHVPVNESFELLVHDRRFPVGDAAASTLDGVAFFHAADDTTSWISLPAR